MSDYLYGILLPPHWIFTAAWGPEDEGWFVVILTSLCFWMLCLSILLLYLILQTLGFVRSAGVVRDVEASGNADGAIFVDGVQITTRAAERNRLWRQMGWVRRIQSLYGIG